MEVGVEVRSARMVMEVRCGGGMCEAGWWRWV